MSAFSVSSLRDNLSRSVPLWTVALMFIVLIGSGLGLWAVHQQVQKLETRLSTQQKDLKNLSEEQRVLSTNLTSLGYDTRQLKFGEADVQRDIESLMSELRDVRVDVFSLCLHVSASRGRYIC